MWLKSQEFFCHLVPSLVECYLLWTWPNTTMWPLLCCYLILHVRTDILSPSKWSQEPDPIPSLYSPVAKCRAKHRSGTAYLQTEGMKYWESQGSGTSMQCSCLNDRASHSVWCSLVIPANQEVYHYIVPIYEKLTSEHPTGNGLCSF